ncbi:MAG: hypothetical protein KGL39_55640 [Patescibacteria group bacterium]|nr:hypothetical protein [Patescibacteria group bacterium]
MTRLLKGMTTPPKKPRQGRIRQAGPALVRETHAPYGAAKRKEEKNAKA